MPVSDGDRARPHLLTSCVYYCDEGLQPPLSAGGCGPQVHRHPQPTLLVPAEVPWRGRQHPDGRPGINGYLCSQPHEVNVRSGRVPWSRPHRGLMHV